MDAYALDSDEEADDNEGDFYEEEFQQTKRNSFEENPMGDGEDLDDDFEFDREPRALPESPLGRKKSSKVSSRVRGLAYDSGVDSPRSSPERSLRVDTRKRQTAPVDDSSVSNFLVETIDLPPGVERTILIWYAPVSSSNLEGLYGENADAVDLKAARLTKQTFRISFRCLLMHGAWQQAQSRVYDRTLGKSIHVRALTSKVISTVPNDDMMLGPKQSTELKIEIIPRKTNPNYSRLISIINMKNKSNIPQICVRSSNMDAHHVIYHSLFYKLLTHSLPSKEKEEEIVAMVRERTKRLQTLFAEKKLALLSSNKERNVRIPAKSRQRIVAVFSPVASETAAPKDVAKSRVEKHKIMLTLPPGGNKKAVTDGGKFDQSKPVWATSKHPFDTRSSVRELLLKSRVCRSIMNVNQKNINFGRITTSSKSSKRLVVQNMSATPLVYSVEKTGSISSGFLQIKEGEVGVVKAFGTKEICFQFQPTLAGPFEEKLKIINVQDPENSVSVTIKAKVVKRETFKLLQSGQTISFGKCLVGEKTDEVKIAVRNTSRKKREYVIQLDPSFTVPTLRPTFYFSVDETPATVITQAQEKKLDEELEKLEHKLRIAITKKKTDKIVKLNAKISQVKALLSGEQLPKEPGTPADSDAELTGRSGGSSEVGEFDPYDSANSDSEMSDLTINIPDSGKTARKLNLDIAPDQLGVSPTSSNLLVSAEESPADTRGWTVTLSLGSPSYKGSGIVEVVWNAAGTFRNVLALTCEVVPHDFLIPVEYPPDRTVNLNFKWCFTSDAGFALSTSLASCVSRSILESVSEAAELHAGQIDFFYHPSNSPPGENIDVTTRTPTSSVGVAIAKAVQRSLCFEKDTLDLGEHQQGDDVRGEVVIHNRSHQALQFLLLAGSQMQDTAVDSPNVSLRFSKVHKLTLQSQVDDSLVICASSNLKTQCYVYEDARLHREATHVTMKGKQSIDLYVAIRPRLSSDAIKTGSTRDLVGGIRVQLFGLQTTQSSEEEKSEMLAEFTVKFVGVAGASIARVTPSLIDFGVEYNSERTQTCQTHEGYFELINMSKALPLGYRLFVTSATEGYSDDDDALHISLKHEKGEIPAGETGVIEFRIVAYTNGLFRRRIMVENIHYPGKVSFVDVVLFVDNGALKCEIPGANAGTDISTYGGTQKSHSLQTLDFGLINVIKLEDELADSPSSSGGEGEPTTRKYRIYGDHGNGSFFEEEHGPTVNTASQSDKQRTGKTLVLTNTTDRAMVVRPLSTLPLTFEWKRERHSGDITAITEQNDLMARCTSTDSARRLHTPPLEIAQPSHQPSIFYGESFSLEAKSSCSLSFRFAAIATTVPLPIDTIESGKLCPLRGMIGIQSFDSEDGTDAEEACTLKVVNVSGSYGEPRFQIAEKCFSLGKIGYGIGWKSSTFQICVRNVSDVAVSFAIANLPACINVLNVCDGSRIQFFADSISGSGLQVPSLRMLALNVEKILKSSEALQGSAWKIQPRTSCVLEMELVRTAEFLAAGSHEFPLRFLNLSNPHNHDDVLVRTQIISSYAELAVDPESSNHGVEASELKDQHIAFLPPVTVPTAQEAPPHRASFWFSLRNVYDEELNVKLSSQTHNFYERTFELLFMLRSANTPLSSLVIAPGESVDIRVVCHVLPSARLPADTWSTGSNGATSEILDLGLVWLDISIEKMEDAAQREEIHVKGKLLPGKTFVLSASSLHFFATATEIPADIPVDQLPPSLKSKTGASRDSAQNTLPGALQQTTASVVHQLRNASEYFWVRNPSTEEVLNFVISPISMYQPGLCLVEGSTESDMRAMSEWIQAIAVPSSGTIAPGESVKVTVHLEEASAPSSNSTSFLEASDTRPAGKLAALHKIRHHPSWRSNSWDADGQETTAEESGQNRMFLTVRDADSSLDSGVSTEVDVLLVLQQQSSTGEAAKQGGVVLDKTLITAAFEARNKRLAQSRKLYPGPTLETHLEDELFEQTESSGLDNFEEFDISSIRSGSVGRKNHLPVLAIRGCTPAEYSSLENTRYLIDVGQHTVRNGGEVEWEITIESLYSATSAADPGLDSVEYRLMLVDKNAQSWLQLSRERGTLDRAHSYQSVVLYFLRGVVGVYSTFMVLQNLANPSDLKVIHVRLEVIADLNSLRGMSSGLDPATNLFRVLVSNHGSPKRSRRSSVEMPPEIPAGGAQRLMIDFSEVYYYKLYQNHSIVIENSSGLSLDFILSTNARPQEVSFSISPMSFNEVTTVTLGAHASMQVFLHFRPQPKQMLLSSASAEVMSDVEVNEPWVREIEVYVSCRLVKDFRETVIIRAICSQPQLMVNVANGETNESPLQREAYFSAQPTFLGLVFPMLESTLSSPELSTIAADETQKYLVVRNTKSDSYARLALRNDSMFFGLALDDSMTQPGAATVDLLDHGVCAGRRSTLLVTIQPQSVAVFRVKPDVAALWKHHQLWDHSVKEHVTLYNIKQFAEHYQVTLCFTCSNVASFYIPPNISESYPISALEDIVAKFLQNYEYTWKWLISYHEKALVLAKHSVGQSSPASKLAKILNDLENALDLVSPLSPRNLTHAAIQTFDEEESVQTTSSRDDLYQLVQSYRALYFDFYYITDELVWHGVRGNAVRHSLALADLAYGVVFNHEVFRSFVRDARSDSEAVAFPRLLLPWTRQLGHFLSFFPENQEATQPLRQVYDQLRKFEAN
ncbi:hypothetical protein PInf_012452 [Phytophthora infestans]|nr:hypothetical protein PInf_012452 [Phytophthora infestans]